MHQHQIFSRRMFLQQVLRKQSVRVQTEFTMASVIEDAREVRRPALLYEYLVQVSAAEEWIYREVVTLDALKSGRSLMLSEFHLPKLQVGFRTGKPTRDVSSAGYDAIKRRLRLAAPKHLV